MSSKGSSSRDLSSSSGGPLPVANHPPEGQPQGAVSPKRLYLVTLGYSRVAGEAADFQCRAGLFSAESPEEALGLAVTEGDAQFPGYSLSSSKAVTDMTAPVTEWVRERGAGVRLATGSGTTDAGQSPGRNPNPNQGQPHER